MDSAKQILRMKEAPKATEADLRRFIEEECAADPELARLFDLRRDQEAPNGILHERR